MNVDKFWMQARAKDDRWTEQIEAGSLANTLQDFLVVLQRPRALDLRPTTFWTFRVLVENKMKPTNPNADTYVEEQRQYLFVTLSSEPTCGTP